MSMYIRSNTNIDKKKWGLTAMIASGILLALLLVCHNLILQLDIRQVAIICTGLVLVAFLMLVSTSRKGLWSIPACYLSVFLLFHFGLVAIYSMGIDVESVSPSWENMNWFYTDDTKYAIYLCTAGLLALILSLYIARCRRPKVSHETTEPQNDLSDHIAPLGFGLLVASLGLWIYSILRNGSLALILGSYTNYLDNVNGSMATSAFFGIGLGLIFLAVAKKSTLRNVGICIFLLWTLVAFPLGLRGEILFPALTALAISAKRKAVLKPIYLVIGAVLLLSLIAFVKEERANGLTSIDWSSVVLNPLNGVAEMGGSLKPVSCTTSWLRDGDPLLYGTGYWAPFDRALVYVIPGWTRPETEDDFRLSSTVVVDRESNIGFSVIAEAYRNGGLLGVLIVMFLLGLLLQKLDTWPATGTKMALAGIILFPLMIHVRNPVSPVPYQMVSGFAILKIYCLVYRNLSRRRSARRFRSAKLPKYAASSRLQKA